MPEPARNDPLAATEDPTPDSAAPTRRVDDGWRCWIAENLMDGGSSGGVLTAMVAAGVARAEAARAIDQASGSPYLRGAEALCRRLKQRDWLLAACRKINRLHPASSAIPRRHRLPRREFLDNYYSTNRPVILTGMVDDWPALSKWNLDRGGSLAIRPRGALTPFARNGTNRLLAQVVGRSRVKVVPSWDVPQLDNPAGDLSAIDSRQTPARPQPRHDEAQILETILDPGEILFLPVESVDCVEALEIAVTVSFTNVRFDHDGE